MTSLQGEHIALDFAKSGGDVYHALPRLKGAVLFVLSGEQGYQRAKSLSLANFET